MRYSSIYIYMYNIRIKNNHSVYLKALLHEYVKIINEAKKVYECDNYYLLPYHIMTHAKPSLFKVCPTRQCTQLKKLRQNTFLSRQSSNYELLMNILSHPLFCRIVNKL